MAEINKELQEINGYIDEGYLKELLSDSESGGAAAATWAFTTLLCLGGIVVATMSFDSCPLSAVTKSCVRP